MHETEQSESWVVYLMTIRGNDDGMNAICNQNEWDALEQARPGYHRLIKSGILNEAEAEKLARGTRGDPKTRSTAASFPSTADR